MRSCSLLDKNKEVCPMKRQLMYFRWRRSWQGWLVLPFLLCLLALLSGTGPVYASANAASAQVTLNLHQTLSTVSPIAVGVNDAAWDGNLADAKVPGLLRAAGVRVMRFPGGSYADEYHWQTNTLDNGSNAGAETFDDFMQVVQKVGATPIITINYGTGTPAEAAAWVQYANITKHYHIRYWEIGNELYGDGTYSGGPGTGWEDNKHPLGPQAYADNALQFIKAMKAVDPTIKVGLVVTAPGNWPDGITNSTYSPQPWNTTVLSTACSAADFVAVHWYPQGPGGETDAGLLAAPANGESTPVSYTPSIPSMVSTLNSEIDQYCGAHASAVKIMTDESNSVSYNPGKQTTNLVNALYLAEDYMTWLENGVTNVDWWDVHNSIVTGTNDSPDLYGTNDFGDYGLLSVGNTGEPPAETPFPDYYGLQMVSRVVGPFDRIVAASSNQSLISAFATVNPVGLVTVLLVNANPATSYDVTFSGVHAHAALVSFYGENSNSISTRFDPRFTSQTLPPYSLTAITFLP
jgi:hypothetical protein